MPVAIPRITNTSTTIASGTGNNILTENGFITRQYPDDNFMGNEDDLSDEFEEDDDEDEENENEEDYTSDDEEDEQGALLNGTRPSGLFEEYFDYEPNVINNRDRRCNHQTTSRPCPFCVPNVSMRLANEVRIAFKAIFNPKVMKFEYTPLDRSIVESPFKALKALHDLTYIKKVLNEIINLIVSIQNVPNYKINYGLSSALLRIHDRTESLLDDIRGSGKYEEYQVVSDFRKKLNSIGLVQGNCKENSVSPNFSLIDCQR